MSICFYGLNKLRNASARRQMIRLFSASHSDFADEIAEQISVFHPQLLKCGASDSVTVLCWSILRDKETPDPDQLGRRRVS
jgi:hypothetical protein